MVPLTRATHFGIPALRATSMWAGQEKDFGGARGSSRGRRAIARQGEGGGGAGKDFAGQGVFPLYRDRFTGEMMMFLRQHAVDSIVHLDLQAGLLLRKGTYRPGRLAVVQPEDVDLDEDADEVKEG